MGAPAITEEIIMITTERRFVTPVEAMSRDAIVAGQTAMATVLSNNASWKDIAMNAIIGLPFATEGTFEDFRNKIVGTVGEPGHPNAWGALAGLLIRNGFLNDTGAVRAMTGRKSHGRKSAVLFRTRKV